MVPFASERSAGKKVQFDGSSLECRPLTPESIQGLDLVLASAGGKVSAEWAPKFVDAGAVVVDNTSYWRMHDDVPLVVAQVNDDAVEGHSGIVANPNCTTMQLMVALKPIHDAAGHRAPGRLHLPVGLGHRPQGDRGAARAVARRCSTASRSSRGSIPHQVAFNVLPQVETFMDGDDYTTEERKVMAETRKILGLSEEVGISATCVRVPVVTGHSESVNVQTRKDLSPEACRELLSGAPGLVVLDDPGAGIYPLPIAVEGRDEVLVGRIRRDPSHERCLNLWVVGDNLRKGAATNAVQVAELLHERDLVRVPASA